MELGAGLGDLDIQWTTGTCHVPASTTTKSILFDLIICTHCFTWCEREEPVISDWGIVLVDRAVTHSHSYTLAIWLRCEHKMSITACHFLFYFVYSWEQMKESGQGEGKTQRQKKGVKHLSERLVNTIWQQCYSAAYIREPHTLSFSLSLPSFYHIYELLRLLSRAWWERYCLEPQGGSVTKHFFSLGHLIAHLCVYCVWYSSMCMHFYLQVNGCIYV